MALELQDVLTSLGIEKAESVEDIQNHVKQHYIPVAFLNEDERVEKAVNAKVGKRIGSAETLLKQIYRSTVGEPEADEFKDKKFEDIANHLSEKITAKHKELAEAVGKGDDGKVEALQKQINKLTKQVEESNGFLTTVTAEKEKVEKEFSGYKTSLTLNQLVSEAKKKVTFSDTANELVLKGFDATFKEKYTVRLPEEGETAADGLVVIDNSTGSQVKNGTKYLPLHEVLQLEAKALNVLKVGGHENGGKPKPVITNKPEPTEGKKIAYANKAEEHLAELQAKK